MSQFVQQQQDDQVFEAKIILLGESTVGKTSILEKYSTGQIQKHPIQTVGVDYRLHEILLDEGVKMKLKIWDTSGQERFRAIAQSFYKNSQGVFLVFDLSNKETLNKLEYWIKCIQENQEDQTCNILVGNKNDLNEEINKAQIHEFCEKYNLQFFSCSAKTGKGIPELFKHMAMKIYDNQRVLNIKDRTQMMNKDSYFLSKNNESSFQSQAKKNDINKKENEGCC